MAIGLGDNIGITGPLPTDNRYFSTLTNKPWTGCTEVTDNLAGGVGGIRYTGLTVNIAGTEYWFRDGIEDGDLIEKTSGGGTITGGTNGLSTSGANLILGGTLTGNTTITGGTNDFYFVGGGASNYKFGLSPNNDGVEVATDTGANLTMVYDDITLHDSNSVGIRVKTGTLNLDGSINIPNAPTVGDTGDDILVRDGSFGQVKTISAASLGSGIAMSGSTVGGLTTYVDGDTICSQSGLTFNGSCLDIYGGGPALNLREAGENHTYMGFYAQSGASTTRSAYFGFPSAGVDCIRLQNEIEDGEIKIATINDGAISLIHGATTTLVTSPAGIGVTGVINTTGTITINRNADAANPRLTFSHNDITDNYVEANRVDNGLYLNVAGNNRLCLGTTCAKFAYLTETPSVRITTGAAAGCVLQSDASGNATWETPTGGGISWTGTEVGGIATYVNGTTACAQTTLKYTGSALEFGTGAIDRCITMETSTDAVQRALHIIGGYADYDDGSADAIGGDVTITGGIGYNADSGGGAETCGGCVIISGGMGCGDVPDNSFGGDVCICGGDACYVASYADSLEGGSVRIKGGLSEETCGSVFLYDGATLRLRTTTTGVCVTGVACATTCFAVGTTAMVDNDVFIRFNGDNPWEFIQDGNTTTAHLALKATIDQKNFLVQDCFGINIAKFQGYNGVCSNVGLYFNGTERLSTQNYGSYTNGTHCATICVTTPVVCASTCLSVNPTVTPHVAGVPAQIESSGACEALRLYGDCTQTGSNVGLRVYNKGGTASGGNCAIYADAYYTAAASTSGRSHGVWGLAGNKTDKYNFGTIGMLCGTQEGAGIYGSVGGYTATPTGLWAGVFNGAVYGSSTMCAATCLRSAFIYSTGAVCSAGYTCALTCVSSPTVCGTTIARAPTVCSSTQMIATRSSTGGAVYGCNSFGTTDGLTGVWGQTASAGCGMLGHYNLALGARAGVFGYCASTTTYCTTTHAGYFVGCVCINNTLASGYALKIDHCACGIDFVATSDRRMKKNITPITSALSTIDCLCGVCYDLCKNDSHDMGLIAQEVLAVEPRLVTTGVPSPEEKDEYGIEDQILGLKYDKFAGLFVEAIKELKEQNTCLQNQINELRKVK